MPDRFKRKLDAYGDLRSSEIASKLQETQSESPSRGMATYRRRMKAALNIAKGNEAHLKTASERGQQTTDARRSADPFAPDVDLEQAMPGQIVKRLDGGWTIELERFGAALYFFVKSTAHEGRERVYIGNDTTDIETSYKEALEEVDRLKSRSIRRPLYPGY